MKTFDATIDSGQMTEACYSYLEQIDNPLVQTRLEHWRGNLDDRQFWLLVSTYQNPDGGFMGGIDADYTGKVSSIHSTIEALRIMVSHRQFDGPYVRRTLDFLRQSMLPDGTWQERAEVIADPLCPQWYHPAHYRIYETASIAGYGLELGFSEAWSKAVKYVRNVWFDMPEPLSPHVYWAALLLVGRSQADEDRSIIFDCIDALSNFIRRGNVDPYDASWIIEILSTLEFPEANDMMLRLTQQLIAAQHPIDGSIRTAYGEQHRAMSTFNALIAIALMNQLGLIF